MKKRLISIVTILGMTASLLSLGGCKSENGGESIPTDNSKPSSEITSAVDNSVSVSPDIENSEPIAINVELNNTYTTKFGETNAITYPAFSFDYPDGWTVAEETVTQRNEMVKLTNDSGSMISFSYIADKDPGGGSAAVMRQVEVSKVADAAFIPGYVQATDYSALGTFMVAELKPIGTLNMQTDKDYTAIEGSVSYAVLPESFIGVHSGLRSDYILDFAFWYSGNVALIADGDFTEQEEQEAIAILASFRDEATSAAGATLPASTGEHVATSLDELWAILEGTWVFEEYTHYGKIQNHSEHDLEFQYADKIPCMRSYYPQDDTYAPDVLFYDLAFINEFEYDAYTYMRGDYGGEGANWSSDVRRVWWSFDLSNLADGELSMTYNIAFDNGFIDNNSTFKYSLK
ncbi:hypothetical protein LJC32_02195 [Oscillospiraceae bacterium OttesenSCG-928-F05]|nr:hypothetical protein [Oscillospiraceae bacterium OttesenSCG-928-F05]